MKENTQKHQDLANNPRWYDKINIFKKKDNQDYELPLKLSNTNNKDTSIEIYSEINCKPTNDSGNIKASDTVPKNNHTYLIKRLKINNFEIGDDEKCTGCRSERIAINNENHWVCRDCGLEYELNYQSNEITGESRAFDFYETNNRKRTEINPACFGARTTIGKYYEDKIPLKMKGTIKRMRQQQNQCINNAEATYRQASAILKRLSHNLELADYVKETAWKIYESVYKKKLTKGISINDFVSASIYASIRAHDISRLLAELIEYSDIDEKNAKEKKINGLVRIIVQNVFSELNLKYKSASAIPYISGFGQELKLTHKEYNEACEIYKSAEKEGLNSSGKDPKGLAAASIYIWALKTGKKITQESISKISNVTEMTIRNRVKELKKYIK